MSYTEPWEWDEDPDPEWEKKVREPMDLNTWGELQADNHNNHDTVQTNQGTEERGGEDK